MEKTLFKKIIQSKNMDGTHVIVSAINVPEKDFVPSYERKITLNMKCRLIPIEVNMSYYDDPDIPEGDPRRQFSILRHQSTKVSVCILY